MTRPALLVSAVLAAAAARAGDTDVLLTLEASATMRPGDVPEAMPPRLVLLEDGQVFVGGTSSVAAGRLESRELKEIEKRLSRVRKIQGLGGSVSFGPGSKRHRLYVRKGRALDVTATGDPAAAPAALRPLASLMADLAAFNHPSLRPYRPATYLLSAKEGSLAGGCRPWTFRLRLGDCVAAPRPVSAEDARDWPTGATPASVCAGDKTYVVTLRPVVPGEKP